MVRSYIDAISPVRPLREGETQSHEGGIVFQADKWVRLRRFLVLGTEGGTYYADGKDLTTENVAVVRDCLDDDPARTVATIVDVSFAGVAPKNEPALLALAMASLDPRLETRRTAFNALGAVARTGTHLLHFVAYRKALGGKWSRLSRGYVGRWFTNKRPHDLAYQAIKYQQRDQWSLRDVVRLSHPTSDDPATVAALRWIATGVLDAEWTPELIMHAEDAKTCGKERLLWLINNFRLPREAVPTQWLNDRDVWEALLQDMPLTAMIRNLGKMTNVGLISPGSEASRTISRRLVSAEALQRSRVHPISILSALVTYGQGQGVRGKLTWTPDMNVAAALDEAFYLAFANAPATGKRIRLAVDVSSSMRGNQVAGMPHLNARMAACALALVFVATEPQVEVLAYSHELVPFPVEPGWSLVEVMSAAEKIPFGGTYCTLPIMHAISQGSNFDAFISLTDNETWNGGSRFGLNRYGSGQWPYQVPPMTCDEALQAYRQESGINAVHAVCAFTATNISIANPFDPRQLDIAGLDSSVPALLANFIGPADPKEGQ